MRIIKQCVLLVLAISLLTSGSAMADHRHGGSHWRGSVGIYVGPGFGPYYPGFYGEPFYYGYPPPYYYGYPAPVIVTPAQQPPPVYIEQDSQSSSGPQQEYFWYHCNKPEGYYPYIKDCPAGWQKVTPEPPQQ